MKNWFFVSVRLARETSMPDIDFIRPEDIEIDEPLDGPIREIIPGWNGDELCQDGECPVCKAAITANKKEIFCPRFGAPAFLP